MKKINYLYIFVLLFVAIIPNVYASNICTNTKINDLKKKASNITAKYELKFDEENQHYFKVTFANVSEDLLIIYGDSIYEPTNGTIELTNYFEGGKTYEFGIYGGRNNSCVEEYISTKKLTVPTYNVYSELDECKNHSEIPICDQFYSGDFNDEVEFKEKLNEYLKKDEDKKETKESEKTSDNDNTLIIVSVVAVSVIVITGVIFVINKNKKEGKGLENEKE